MLACNGHSDRCAAGPLALCQGARQSACVCGSDRPRLMRKKKREWKAEITAYPLHPRLPQLGEGLVEALQLAVAGHRHLLRQAWASPQGERSLRATTWWLWTQVHTHARTHARNTQWQAGYTLPAARCARRFEAPVFQAGARISCLKAETEGRIRVSVTVPPPRPELPLRVSKPKGRSC